MVRTPKHLLIVDNTTTCAMRIKTLAQIHGAKAKLVHWSEWDRFSINEMENLPCMLIIEQTVPLHVVHSLLDTLPNIPLFILFNPNKPLIPWPIKRQINPLSSALSNFEIVSIIEPYWLEDKTINLPNVVVIDSTPESAFQINSVLSQAHIPCTLTHEVNLTLLQGVDLVLVNISENKDRLGQLEKIKQTYPLIGAIVYGEQKSLSSFKFIEFALKVGVNDILDIQKLESNWLAKFNRVWQKTAEMKEELLVSSNIQKSFDVMLEKSLISKVLMANSMDGILAFSEDGSILKNNDGFCELLGLIDEQVKNANVFNLISSQSKKQLQKLLYSDYLFQQQFLDLHLLHEHGVAIPVSVSINRINLHGQYVYIAVMRNNVNQQLQKKILVQQNARLEHKVKEVERQKELLVEFTRKNNRKQNMFMSHFTRYLIAQNESENQMTNEVIHKLYNLDLICKLQAEQEPIRFQTINLKTMIDKTLVVLEDAISAKKISVINDVNTEVVVRFTEDHLQKIIYELLHNSVLYNLQEASIQITSQYQAEQRVELIIADTGLGILEHKQLSIFDLQEINDGTSIETCCTGLPLCKLLAQHNQADIQVDNNYQKTKVIGSIFSLYMEKE